jgi:hypothetical protein
MGLVAVVALAANQANRGLKVVADEMTYLVAGMLVTYPFIGLPVRRIRSFCLGFAVLAWGYLFTFFSPLGGYLPTTLALESLNPHYDVEWESSEYDERIAMREEATRSSLIAAGHSSTALVLGLVGGAAFHLLSRRKIDDDSVVDPFEGRLLNPDRAGWITDDARDGR